MLFASQGTPAAPCFAGRKAASGPMPGRRFEGAALCAGGSAVLPSLLPVAPKFNISLFLFESFPLEHSARIADWGAQSSWHLTIGIWDFFGVWDLGFGIHRNQVTKGFLASRRLWPDVTRCRYV